MNDFGKRVIYICDYLGIKPYHVWKRTNLTKSTFYRCISSKSKSISTSNAMEIIKALDLPADLFRIPMEDLRETMLLYCYRKLDEENKKKLFELMDKID